MSAPRRGEVWLVGLDPVKGHELYNRHLRTMIRAEQLGFDGLAINEPLRL